MGKTGIAGNVFAAPFLLPTPGTKVEPFRQQVSRMNIRFKLGQSTRGHSLELFNSPHGICLGREYEIVVADTGNHRIKVIAGF